MPSVSHSVCSDHISHDAAASRLEALTKHEQHARYNSAHSVHSLVLNTDEARNDRKQLESPPFSTEHYHARQGNPTEVIFAYLRLFFIRVECRCPPHAKCLQGRDVRVSDILTKKSNDDNQNEFTEARD